jgi:hypothetical protein
MPLFSQVVQVTSAAGQIFPFGAVPGGPKRISVYNNGPNAIYVGPAGITSSTGFRVAPQTSFTFSERTVNGPIFAYCDSLQVSPADTRILVEVAD